MARNFDVASTHRNSSVGRFGKPKILHVVEELDRRFKADLLVALENELRKPLFAEDVVLESEFFRHDRIENDASRGRFNDAAFDENFDFLMDVQCRGLNGRCRSPSLQLLVPVVAAARMERHQHFFRIAEYLDPSSFFSGKNDRVVHQVVETQNHVLRWNRDRLSGRRKEDVVGRHHQKLRFELRFDGKRNVHRHLVPVEVGVERRRDERMDPDRFSFDQDRFKCLDPETVKRRSSVQENRVSFDDLFENVPNFGGLFLDHFFRGADRIDIAEIFEPLHDERLKEIEGHLLRKTALVEFELRTDDDDGSARVIDPFSEKVLTEASLFAFEHFGKGFERAVSRSHDRMSMAAVIEEGIDCFLEHPLFVADDDIRRFELEDRL